VGVSPRNDSIIQLQASRQPIREPHRRRSGRAPGLAPPRMSIAGGSGDGDARSGGSVRGFEAMGASETPGARGSADTCEVKRDAIGQASAIAFGPSRWRSAE